MFGFPETWWETPLAKDGPIVMTDIAEEVEPKGDIPEIFLVGEQNKEHKDDGVVKNDDGSILLKEEDKEIGSNQSNTMQDHKEDDVNRNDEKALKSETVFTLSKTTTTLVTS